MPVSRPRRSSHPSRGWRAARRPRPLAAGVVAVAFTLGSTAVALRSTAVALGSPSPALAASSVPTLVAPANHGSVHPNSFQLVVRDASSLARRYGVFVSISRSRKTRANGELERVSHVKEGESFVKLKQWKGHAGMWIYKPPKFSFPGYWAHTAGRYYWQAQHTDCRIKGCEALSKIKSFHVTGQGGLGPG